MNPDHNYGIKGLSTDQVAEARLKFGQNEVAREKHHFRDTLKDILKEPMVLLLLVAALLYFISGETADAIFMTSAIVTC